jgi:hypothetical protein
LILLQFGFSGLHENRSHFKVLAACSTPSPTGC